MATKKYTLEQFLSQVAVKDKDGVEHKLELTPRQKEYIHYLEKLPKSRKVIEIVKRRLRG